MNEEKMTTDVLEQKEREWLRLDKTAILRDKNRVVVQFEIHRVNMKVRGTMVTAAFS